MKLSTSHRVHFEKYGRGYIHAIRTSVIGKKTYRFVEFHFDTERKLILPEVLLNKYSWYRVMDEKGQSLVGMLVSVAILSIMTLMAMQLNTSMIKSTTTFQANSDMMAYVNQLRGDIQYSTSATVAVTGQDVTKAVFLKDPITGVVVSDVGYKQQPTDAWSVGALYFTNVVNVPSQANYYRATLTVQFSLDNTRIYGKSTKPTVIGDLYCTIVSNIIQSCYGSTDLMTMAQSNCQALGGTWNANLAFGTQCVFPSNNVANTASNGAANPNNSSPCSDNTYWNYGN